ncbi:MAG: peptidylprolyl isomerase [Clostridia bacterium]|nr:peptidylprolyl isomerase [Clostridia bacterium]
MSNNQVLATVGDRQITQGDVEFLLKTLDPQSSKRLDSPNGRKRVLQELINQELFFLDAIEKGIDNDAAYKAEIEKMKTSYLKQYAISKLLANITVSDKEISDYYEQNKQLFVNQESIKASHILVSSEEKASEILSEINGGLSFEEAAERYSSCPSKSNGGDLGFFTRGRMVPEFEKAAFETDIGQVSGPVKTQFGYHIIKVLDKSPVSEKSLDEVKGQINQQLIADKQESVFFTKVNELKEKYEVKICE